MSQMPSNVWGGGLLGSFASLSPADQRLFQISDQLAKTIKDPKKRQSSQLSNLLGLGSGLKLQGTADPFNSLGGLGNLFDNLS